MVSSAGNSVFYAILRQIGGYRPWSNGQPGLCILLTSDSFCRLFVFSATQKGLLLKEDITSPTFTIINEYHEGRFPFYHFDVYRLKNPDEVYELGFDEYFFGDGVCLIEWAEIIKETIPKSAIWIKIEKDLSKNENYRIIKIDE